MLRYLHTTVGIDPCCLCCMMLTNLICDIFPLKKMNNDCALVFACHVNSSSTCVANILQCNKFVHNLLQSLELWSPAESSKTWAVHAHKGLIAGLADSPENEMVASASHDHCVKLWK